LGVRTTPAISRVCDINWQAAQFRAERMEQLYRRESLFIRKYGTSCFLQSALERQVYDQFAEFIDQQRALQPQIDVLA